MAITKRILIVNVMVLDNKTLIFVNKFHLKTTSFTFLHLNLFCFNYIIYTRGEVIFTGVNCKFY